MADFEWEWYCNTTLQDCVKRYPRNPLTGATFPEFENGSCVIDLNYVYGDAGTCGWAGAKCSINTKGFSTCVDGDPRRCQNGKCKGLVGDTCSDIDCLPPVGCNGTHCGGNGVRLTGYKNATALCMSGSSYTDVFQNPWCGPSPNATGTTGPSSTHKSTSIRITGGTVGLIVGLIVALALLIASVYWYRRNRRRPRLTVTDPGGKKASSQENNSPDISPFTEHASATGRTKSTMTSSQNLSATNISPISTVSSTPANPPTDPFIPPPSGGPTISPKSIRPQSTTIINQSDSQQGTSQQDSSVPSPSDDQVSSEPASQAVDSDLEQRLMELQNEAARTLAEYRARHDNEGAAVGETPPPYE